MRTAAAVSLLNFSFHFVLLPIHSSPFSIKSFSLVSTEILCRDLACNVFFQYSEETYETSALINNAETTSSNCEDWQRTPHSLPLAQILCRQGDTFPSVCHHAGLLSQTQVPELSKRSKPLLFMATCNNPQLAFISHPGSLTQKFFCACAGSTLL